MKTLEIKLKTEKEYNAAVQALGNLSFVGYRDELTIRFFYPEQYDNARAFIFPDAGINLD